MLHLSDETIKDIVKLVVSLLGAIWGVAATIKKKRKARISDRRDSSVPHLRAEKYVFQNAYGDAYVILENIREELAVAARLRERDIDCPELLDNLAKFFPENKVPNLEAKFRRRIEEAEKLHNDLADEPEPDNEPDAPENPFQKTPGR